MSLAKKALAVFGTLLVLGAGGSLTYYAATLVMNPIFRGGRFAIWGWLGLLLGLLVTTLGLVAVFGKPRRND